MAHTDRLGRGAALMIAGPAGARRYVNATVAVNDMEGRTTSHAARGGMGSVMGVKRPRAIVLDDTGCSSSEAADLQGSKQAVRAASESLRGEGIVGLMQETDTDFWYQVECECWQTGHAGRHRLRLDELVGISDTADRLPEWLRREPLAPHDMVFDVPQEEIFELFDFSKTIEFMEL